MRLPQGRRCDRPAGGRSHRLNPSRHCTVPSICIDPPGTHFTSTPVLSTPSVIPSNLVQPCTNFYQCSSCTLSNGSAPEANYQKLFSPMNCEDTPPDGSSAEAEDMEEPQNGDLLDEVSTQNNEDIDVTEADGLKFGAEIASFQ